MDIPKHQQKYLALRQRLLDLNYTGSFGIDAADLVGSLLHDLVETTSAYKTLQDKEARLSADLSLAQTQLFPLRKENAHLRKENQQVFVVHLNVHHTPHRATRHLL
jgi:hypothetical protein